MSHPQSAPGIGTGHGVYMTLHDPLVPINPETVPPTYPPFGSYSLNSPLGRGQVGTGTGTYLIRDLQLHEEIAVPHDVTHLGSARSREYEQYDLPALGGLSFNVLFDAEIQDEYDPDAAFPGYDFPLPRMDPRYDLQEFGAGNQNHDLGSGQITFTFPIRNSIRNIPARLTSMAPATSSETNTGLHMDTGAFVISRNFGMMATNTPHICRVMMQWKRKPYYYPEITHTP